MEVAKRGCTDNIEFSKIYLQIWTAAMRDQNMIKSWGKNKEWTDKHMANILYPLAEKLNYYLSDCNKKQDECLNFESCVKNGRSCYGVFMQKEYYNVDFTLYNWFKQSHWALDYAIEHENDAFNLNNDNSIKDKGWFDEFAKLLPLKCVKSRVIIGYDDFKDIENKLGFCEELLKDSGVMNSCADGKILLIIFPRKSAIGEIIKNTAMSELCIVEFDIKNNMFERKQLTDSVLSDVKIKNKLDNIYNKLKA